MHYSYSLVPRLYPCARTQTNQKCNESEVGLSASARVKPGNEAIIVTQMHISIRVVHHLVDSDIADKGSRGSQHVDLRGDQCDVLSLEGREWVT